MGQDQFFALSNNLCYKLGLEELAYFGVLKSVVVGAKRNGRSNRLKATL